MHKALESLTGQIMIKISIEKVFYFTNWLSYLSLGFAAIYFITYSNVLGKYMAQRSATIEFEEYVKERPTITVQFIPSTGIKDLIMGIDFNMSFWMELPGQFGKIINLKYGKNEYLIDNYTFGTIHVKLERDHNKLAMLKISTNSGISKRNLTNEFHGFQFDFDNSTLKLENLRIRFQMTSEDNFIRFDGPFYDGDPLVQNIYAGHWKTLEIQPIQYNYLNLKRSPCREKPFVRSVFQYFSKTNVDECLNKCNPMENGSYVHGLINEDIPNCETEMEKECIENYIMEKIVQETVKKPCHKLQYSGKILNENIDKSNLVTLWYHFVAPGFMIVKEEYLIYDLIAMIGSVGGTLGLCIGFSFFNVIDHLLNCFKKIISNDIISTSVESYPTIQVKELEVKTNDLEISKILQTKEFHNCLRKEVNLAIKSFSK